MKLDKQIAVVTGASSGIGQAIAITLAKAGAAVVVVYHDDPKGAADTEAAITKAGGKCAVVAADVGQEGDVEQLFNAAQSAFGAPTLLVNSAGVDSGGVKVREMTLEAWEAALRTNLTGPFLTCRAFLRGLKGKEGKIINISSIHEDIPRSGAAEYCASKGGIRMLTRVLALEMAGDNVTVNSIAPGMVLTPMNQDAIDDPKVLAKDVESIPLKRAAQPQEVADLALYLAAEARYATGATFTLDGGLEISTGQGA